MRKLMFVFFAIFTLTVGTISGFSEYSDKATHNHPQQPGRTVDGSKTPELIPDHAAQEVFLRSLVPRPDEGEAGHRRVRAFAEETGLEGADVDALLALAQNFVTQASVLDNQVKEIKDKNWPQPSQSVKADLVQLQSNKRAIIADTAASFATRLRAYASVGKVHSFITERVKRQMTSFTPSPLTHKQSKLKDYKHGIFDRLFGFGGPSSFTTLAAAPTVQLMGEGYTYSNAAHNIAISEGYTYGSTVEDYSSFGHEYRITVTAWLGSTNAGSSTYPAAPDYYSPPISTSKTVSLILGNGVPFDGFLSTTTSGEGFCPISFNSFSTSSSQAQSQQIGPTVRISAVTFSPDEIARTSGQTTLTVQVSASTTVPAGTTVKVEAFQNTNSGPNGQATLSIAPTNGQNTSSSCGTGPPCTATFTITTPSSNPNNAIVTYQTRIILVTPPQGGATASVGAAQNNGISNNLTVL